MILRCVLVAVFLICSCSVNAQTYYLLRHFDKQNLQPDPGLTATGERRSMALVELLRDKTIRHIFSSDYARTRASVAPLAEARSLSVHLYDPRDLNALAAQLRKLDGAVVVGHSNTTPQLVRLLGGTAENMQEQDFGDVYVLTRTQGAVETQRLSVPAHAMRP